MDKRCAVIAGTGPTLTISSGGLYALNAFTAAGCKFAFDEILLGYRPELPIVDPPDINLCALFAPSYTFPTINQTAVIMTALDPADYAVSYYTTYEKALAGLSTEMIPVASLDNYTTNNAGEEIWVRVQETAAHLFGCYKIISFLINAYGIQTGEISYSEPVYCADSNTPQPVHSTASTGGFFAATPNGLQLDSSTGTIIPSQSSGGVYQVVYSVPASGSCPAYSTLPAFVTINATFANPPDVISPVNYCQNETVATLTASGVDLLWYQEASGGVGSTNKPVPNSANVGATTYFVSQTVGGCESQRAPITVNIFPVPNPPTLMSPIVYCIGSTALPLTANGTNLIWYESAFELSGSTTAPIPMTDTLGITTYYVSQTVNGCESNRQPLTVVVETPSSKPQATSPVVYCLNENAQPLFANGVNLLWYSAATGGQGNPQPPVPSTSISGNFDFYVSQNFNGCESDREVITVEVIATDLLPQVVSPVDYCLNETAIPLTAVGTNLIWYTTSTTGSGTAVAPTPSTSASGLTTYYVSQTLSGCEGPRASIAVNVFDPPSFVLPSDGILCTNATATVLRSFVLETGLSPLDYSFEWFDLNQGNTLPIVGAFNSSLEVFEPGDYGAIATDLITGCPSDLVVTNVMPVYPPADFNFTASEYFDDPTTLNIDVVPAGSYEYQIDDSPFQEDASFNNIAFGPHTVTVRDINQCASMTKDLFFVNYPKFFTPNGDGYNDTWNIKDLASELNTSIHIFDRFGKFLIQIYPYGAGWDGTYNQSAMPSTDYWFVIYYNENSENKVFKAHFALKR